jgi:small subunit ribosomal protein S2
VDTNKEDTAVREARRLGMAVVGLIDTNSDPGLTDYPIPGNDDATKSIRLIASIVADTIIEGRKKFLSYLSQEGVAIKEEKKEAEPIVLPEEEVKIKEIEEMVETEEPPGEGEKPLRRPHARQATEEKTKTRGRAK